MAAEQPKKPVGGAYGQFLLANRAKFSAELQGKPGSAVAKLAGERWKVLPPTGKATFEKMYEEAKAKFDKDMAEFLASGGEKKARKRKGDNEAGGKRRKKDKDAPKRPAGGAYGCFLSANRAKFTTECNGAFLEVTKLAGQKWKQLSKEEQKPYELEYQKLKAEYEKAMQVYRASKPAEAADEDEDNDEDEEEEEEEEEENDEEKVPVAKKPASRSRAGA